MSHNWYKDRQALLPMVSEVRFAVNVGAAGALSPLIWNPTSKAYVALPAGGGGGIKSVTRTGTGAWTVVLDQPYQRVVGFQQYSQAAGGLAAAPGAAVNSTGTNVNSQSSPQVNIIFLSSASTAADPASGEQIVVTLELQMGTGSNA